MNAKIVGCLFGLLLLAPVLTAQLTRGFVSGTVQDPSAAVIADVDVTLINKATGIKQTSATNGLGVYRFVAVEPGDYSVEFAKQGFEAVRVGKIRVGAAQEVVVNQTLAVAAAATKRVNTTT